MLPPRTKSGHYPAQETLQVLIANKLRSDRLAAGLSQAELARRSGVREETISRIEDGQHSPSIPTVDKLQKALNQASP